MNTMIVCGPDHVYRCYSLVTCMACIDHLPIYTCNRCSATLCADCAYPHTCPIHERGER